MALSLSALPALACVLALGDAVSTTDTDDRKHDLLSSERPEEARKRFRLVLAGAALLFFYVGAEVTAGAYIDSFMRAGRLQTSKAVALSANTTYWATFAVGRVLSVPLASRLSPQRILLLALSGACCSLLLAMISLSTTTATVSFALLGFSLAPCFAAVFSFVDSLLELRPRESAMLATGSACGELALPLLFSIVVHVASINFFLVSLVGVLFAGVSTLLWLNRIASEL